MASAYESQIAISQFEGVNQSGGDASVPLHFAFKAENMHTERGILERAGGYEAFMPPVGASIGTLARFYRRNHEPEEDREVYVAATMDGVYTWTEGSEAWIKRYPEKGVPQKDTWAHVAYETVRNGETVDVLLMTNNADGIVILYGDTLEASKLSIKLGENGKELKFAVLERHSERIWGTGIEDEPDNLYYSRPYDLLNWEPDEDAPEMGGGMIQQPTWDGDHFVSLKRFGAYLMACKRKSLYIIRGTDPSTYSIEECYGNDAPAAAQTVAVDGTSMIYLSQNGIGIYDGNSAQLLAKNAIYETMSMRTTFSERTACACIARHVYYLALPIRTNIDDTHTNTNNAIIEYDMLRGTFMLRTGIAVKSFLATGGKVYFTSVDTPYQVYRMGGDNGYNHSPIKAFWETGYFDLGGKNIIKSAFTVRFFAQGEIGTVLTITITTDKKEKVKTVSLTESGKMHKVRIPNRGRRFKMRIASEGVQKWSITGGVQVQFSIDEE